MFHRCWSTHFFWNSHYSVTLKVCSYLYLIWLAVKQQSQEGRSRKRSWGVKSSGAEGSRTEECTNQTSHEERYLSLHCLVRLMLARAGVSGIGSVACSVWVDLSVLWNNYNVKCRWRRAHYICVNDNSFREHVAEIPWRMWSLGLSERSV